MEITLTSNVPCYTKPYRTPFALRSVVGNITSELLDSDIRPSDSPYASGIVVVKKQNGEYRLCVDYRRLNSITVKIPFPMPNLEEQFAQLAGNTYFSQLDLRMGYHQVEVCESSKQFTAFVTSDGHYDYNRMPFGLVNAPAVFQAVMNKIVKRMEPGEVLAYLDDVIVPSKTFDGGIQRLEKFFRILKESGLTLRYDKCKFLQSEITLLGHIVNKDGITPGENKLSAIKNFKVPNNVKDVRRFLGLTGFFRKFVENYSLIIRPLTRLLRKSDQNSFDW